MTDLYDTGINLLRLYAGVQAACDSLFDGFIKKVTDKAVTISDKTITISDIKNMNNITKLAFFFTMESIFTYYKEKKDPYKFKTEVYILSHNDKERTIFRSIIKQANLNIQTKLEKKTTTGNLYKCIISFSPKNKNRVTVNRFELLDL